MLGYFAFVAAAVFVHRQISGLVFWVALFFFGGGGLLMLKDLLHPPRKLGDINPPTGDPADAGFFDYGASGFTLTWPAERIYCRWADIGVLFGYKAVLLEERFRSAEICLDIFTIQPARITVTASTPGWLLFLIKLREQLPDVPENWVERIALPAFESNETLLFDRQGRTQSQIVQIYSPDTTGG